jgi:hypothetical protein
MLGVNLEIGDVADRMVDTWDEAVADEEMIFDSEVEELTLKKQCVDLVATYLARVPDDDPAPLAVEATMEAPLVDPITDEDLGIPLLGVVDLIVPGTGGAKVVDFKTSSRSTPPLEISHEIQLSCYAYLFRQVTGEHESRLEIRSLIKTKVPKLETHQYEARTERHFARLFAVIREYIDALYVGRFSYRPGWGCAMCDFRNTHCQGWPG